MPHCLGIVLDDVLLAEHTNCREAPVPSDTDGLDARFLRLRLTNVLLTKLNAGESAIYL